MNDDAGNGRGGRRGRPAGAPEPAIRVDPDFEDEYPAADALATECYANLYRAGDLLKAEDDRRLRAEFDLSSTAGMVLAIIEGAGEPISPSTIADRLIVSTASVTSLIDTLERRGLVERRPHPSDRRRVLVEITDEAHDVLALLLPGLHQLEKRMFEQFTRSELKTFRDLLARVQRRATELASEEPHLEPAERRVPDRVKRNGQD